MFLYAYKSKTKIQCFAKSMFSRHISRVGLIQDHFSKFEQTLRIIRKHFENTYLKLTHGGDLIIGVQDSAFYRFL